MSEKPRVLLVTGAAGYVGSHCVTEFLNAGFRVIAIDNFSNATKGGMPASLERVEQLTKKKISFIEADLRVKEDLRKVLFNAKAEQAKIDCVIHFAALKSVGQSVAKPLEYYANNVTGSANLLEVMMEFGVKNIVFSSSATVYGEPKYLPIDENHQTGGCTNPYGKTKFFMEEIMKDVCTANPEWSCTLLRYFNPVGAHPSGRIGEDPLEEPNNLMPYVAQVAMGRRTQLSVFGSDWDTEDGTGCRDYIHVMDLATGHTAAVKQILDSGSSGTRVYNLGTGKGTTVLQLVDAFKTASGKPVPYRLVGRRPGDVASCFASADKAADELGWRAERSIQDCCESEYNWQVLNPNGYRG